MPMTLEQYAEFLTTRDLVWPVPPVPQPVKARPHTCALPEVRLVAWNIYGTLLSISTGGLVFEHPQKLIMDVALDKTVQEFKMWGSMSRKPGQPSEYMGELYRRALDEQRLASSPNEKFPEFHAERIWDNIVKKLQQKDYKFDAGFFGSLNEYVRKIAYFFHASMQGTAAYPHASHVIESLTASGLKQGLLADAQCFTLVQLQRGLGSGAGCRVESVFPASLRSLSHEVGGRKPSERLYRHFLAAARGQGIEPGQILHVGSRIVQDIAPAKKLGMKTALFAGDKESLQASAEQLKDPHLRPDLLITDLAQLADVFAR